MHKKSRILVREPRLIIAVRGSREMRVVEGWLLQLVNRNEQVVDGAQAVNGPCLEAHLHHVLSVTFRGSRDRKRDHNFICLQIFYALLVLLGDVAEARTCAVLTRKILCDYDQTLEVHYSSPLVGFSCSCQTH